MSVNKAILVGRLGRDPELRYTPGGRAVASFSIATTERWTGQDGQRNESTTWHNIVAWGRQAEVMKEYLSKGRLVYIEGRIDNRTYDDKEGNKRFTSEVVVQNFQFLESRGASGGGDQSQSQPEMQSSPDYPPERQSGGDDDDLPF
ncbi:single-stranded DNA-binding protein [candidate division GN15 bacterium]|jgi:single-strand DNA-binding protein|nr:single-stranded DNA-binding protein [candidate division GN15 bacterium]